MKGNLIGYLFAAVIVATLTGVQGQTPYRGEEEAHVKVVLRVTKGGTAEVVAATEMPGRAIYTEAPAGNYLYEITDGVRTVGVEAVPDPFLERGFEGPIETPRRGHRFQPVEKGTVVVSVPGSLSSPAIGRMGIRLYRRETEDRIETVNSGVIESLKLNRKVSTRLNAMIGPDILRKARKSEEAREAAPLPAQPMSDPTELRLAPAMP